MKPLNILIAEDTEDLRLVVVDLLQMEGHNTIEAVDGQEAWEYLQSHDLPDLLISDLMMPRMNGIELITRVKQNYPKLCVLVYSASGHHKAEVEGLGYQFISKPFDLNQLTEIISDFSKEGYDETKSETCPQGNT